MSTAQKLFRRFIRQDSGDDIVEYALLLAIFAIAGILVFPAIVTAMGDAFTNWDNDVNDIWVPDDPL